MEACPSAEELRSFGRNSMPDSERARIREHVAGCDACRRAVDAERGSSGPETRTISIPPESTPAVTGGEEVPGYEIVSEIHRGGQGIVYKAVQKTTKRLVALKLLRHGRFATAREQRRFEREIDLVAGLQHPHIVTLFDSGTVGERPFYAMQYLHGETLLQHVQKRRLGVREILRLFLKVCSAVSYAHQRGVTHRDLKPENILVSSDGEPHVLDFGLAKAAGSLLARDGVPVSMTGEFSGTLAYASPEQVRGDPSSVDTRSDVYSLGVILYELLTGRLPVPVNGPVSDVFRRISETDPGKPSRHSKHIDDELDTIVLEALAKERDRRYQSVDALAKDVERYLEGRAIEAKGDSGWYVIRKTLRRYRVPVALAAVFVALLLVFAVCVSVLATRIARERDRTREAEADARRAAYTANLAAAEASLRDGSSHEAKARLALCDPEFRGWEWRHLSYRADTSLAASKASGHPVSAIEFSTDGKTVRWSAGPVFYSADAHTLQLRSAWETPDEGPSRSILGFSPDGARVVTRGKGDALQITPVGGGPSIPLPDLDPTLAYRAAFDPSGTRVAIVSIGGRVPDRVEIRDPRSGTSIRRLDFRDFVPIGRVDTPFPTGIAAWSPDGTKLAAGCIDGAARIFDTETGRHLRTLRGHDSGVKAVEWNPEGTRLASGAWDDTARIWDPETGRLLATLRGHADRSFALISAIAFVPGGDRLVTGSRGQSVVMWDLASQEVRATLLGHEETLSAAAVSPDGRRIATGSRDGAVRIWESTGSGGVVVLRCGAPMEHVAFGAAGDSVFAGGWSGGVQEWSEATGSLVRRIECDRTRAIRPSAQRALCRSGDEMIAVDFGSNLPMTRFNGAGGSDYGALSPDGTVAAIPTAENGVQLLDAGTGAVLHTLRGHEDSVSALAFDVGGTRLASGSEDRLARIWDVRSGDLIAILRGHEGDVRAVAFHPDGRRIATGSSDRTIRIWDAASGRQVAVLSGHEAGLYTLSFSPDGRRIASGSRDTTVRVWDPDRAEQLVALRGHDGHVWGLDWSPDGARLASASADGTVRIWQSRADR